MEDKPGGNNWWLSGASILLLLYIRWAGGGAYTVSINVRNRCQEKKNVFYNLRNLMRKFMFSFMFPPPKKTGDRSALAQAKVAISTNLLQTFNSKRWTQSRITVVVSVPESKISKILKSCKSKHPSQTLRIDFLTVKMWKAARMVGNCIINKHCYLQTANETNENQN